MTDKNILEEPLPYEDLKVILGQLFNFDVEIAKDGGIEIIDEHGYYFYNKGRTNTRHDLFTLGGIFQYLDFITKIKTEKETQNKIKIALGL